MLGEIQIQEGMIKINKKSPNIYINEGIKRARLAGINKIDIYVFLQFKNDPRKQIRDSIQYIQRAGQKFDRIWLDIEGRVNFIFKNYRIIGEHVNKT
jgi:hypothetical protein